MPIPVTEADVALCRSLFATLDETAGYLWSRWQDEREYEDINDYAKVFAAKLPAGVTLLKMTKRPFGFHYSIPSGARFHFTVTGRSVGFKQIH